MARITVEDCIDKFPSRFELVLVASQRARKLHSGDQPTIEKDNDKNTVIALREIAESSFTVDEMKENLIQEYQTVTITDEEEENLEIENSDLLKDSNETTSENTIEKQEIETNVESEIESEVQEDAESELSELIAEEDSQIEDQLEVNDTIDLERETSSSEKETLTDTENNNY